MGTSPHLGVSGVHCTMRAAVFVLLGAVAINAEAEADPLLAHPNGVKHVAGVYSHPYHYNLPYGKREAEAEAEADPLMNHHTGVGHTVAGVYNAHIPAVHHVAGVHPVQSVAPVAPVVHAGVKHVAGVYSHPFHYNNFLYGKREAEAEAEADPLLYQLTGVAHVGGVHPVH